MAEEDLKKAILEKIQAEKETILTQAKQERDKILQQAKDEAFSLKEGYLKEIQKTSLLKKSKELNTINLELRRQLREAREEKIFEVFALTREALKTIREDRNRYKSIFRYLLREALNQIPDKGTRFKLKVNPADQGLASEVLKELKADARIETKESVDMGLELCNSEESIVVLNTFESRLNKLMLELRQQINKILFGE